MSPAEVDVEPLVRLAAALSAQPAELVAAVRLAAGPDLPELLESPERLRRLAVQTLLRGREQRPHQTFPAPHPTFPEPHKTFPAPHPPFPELVEGLVDRVDALARLERAVLVLLDLERLTRAEVAGIVDRPAATVDQLRERAYAELGTEPDELSAVLAALSGRPVDPAEVRRAETVLIRGQRRRTRRRGVLMAAVLVAIVAVVLPGALRTTTPPSVFVRGHRDWVLSYRLSPPGTFRIDSRTVGADVETAVVNRPNGPGRCQISVSQAGAAGRAGVTVGQSVEVHGRPARLVSQPGQAKLHWSPADGLTADVSCSTMTDAEPFALELAEKMIFEAQPILLPYRLGPLPSHFHVDQVTIRPQEGATVVDLWPDEVAPTGVPIALSQTDDRLGGRGAPALANYGMSACQLVGQVSVCAGFAAPGAPDAPTEQQRTTLRLKMIMENMIMADSGDDHSTWIDARSALPRD